MAGGKIPLIFKIYKGDTFIREESIAQAVIKVGKLSSSHLRLDDDTVSRMHAVIEVSGPEDVSIIDLGSTKGTLVNGQKVNKAKLQSGDEISLGDTRIEVTIGTEAEAADSDDQPTLVKQKAVANVVSSSPRPDSAPLAPPPPPMAASTSAPPQGGYVPPPAFGADVGDTASDIPGARAIEVATMLGESVVGVKHCMNPRGGKVTAMTYGMFALGAAMMILAAASFTKSVSVAKQNKADLREWVEVKKRPAHRFQEQRLGTGYDIMAFGGIVAGLICFTVAMVRLREERVPVTFTVGTASGVDFAIDGFGHSAFPLVAPLGDEFTFNFTSTMEGELVEGGQSTPLSSLAGNRARPSSASPGASELVIPAKSRIRVKAGNNTLLVSSVPQPRRHPAPLFVGITAALVVSFAGTAFIVLGLLGLIKTIPPDMDALAVDLGTREERVVVSQSTANEEDEKEEEKEKDNSDEAGGTGTAMALDEGKMGKKDSDRKEGRYKLEKKNDTPSLSREQALERAITSGVVGELRANMGDMMSSITSTSDISSGLDDATVYGGLLGDEAGEMQGGFGFGRSGFGRGGGGTGMGTIGLGGYGTIGHGAGTGSGYGSGSGRGLGGKRKAKIPDVKIGSPTATGDLDKATIRRYIRRRRAQIKHCYEKELQVKQALRGTVVTQFTISPSGSVIASSGSGVDGKVAGCIARVIRGIQFPKPRGGGLVQVRYPFHVRAR